MFNETDEKADVGLRATKANEDWKEETKRQKASKRRSILLGKDNSQTRGRKQLTLPPQHDDPSKIFGGLAWWLDLRCVVSGWINDV